MEWMDAFSFLDQSSGGGVLVSPRLHATLGLWIMIRTAVLKLRAPAPNSEQ